MRGVRRFVADQIAQLDQIGSLRLRIISKGIVQSDDLCSPSLGVGGTVFEEQCDF